MLQSSASGSKSVKFAEETEPQRHVSSSLVSMSATSSSSPPLQTFGRSSTTPSSSSAVQKIGDLSYDVYVSCTAKPFKVGEVLIHARDCKLNAPPTPTWLRANPDGSENQRQHNDKRQINFKQRVTATEIVKDWVKVKTSEGVEGWLRAGHVMRPVPLKDASPWDAFGVGPSPTRSSEGQTSHFSTPSQIPPQTPHCSAPSRQPLETPHCSAPSRPPPSTLPRTIPGVPPG